MKFSRLHRRHRRLGRRRRRQRRRRSRDFVVEPKHRPDRPPVPAERRRLAPDPQLPENAEAHFGRHQVGVDFWLKRSITYQLSFREALLLKSCILVILRHGAVAHSVERPSKVPVWYKSVD